jgi:hypothetical protein
MLSSADIAELCLVLLFHLAERSLKALLCSARFKLHDLSPPNIQEWLLRRPDPHYSLQTPHITPVFQELS